MKTHEKFLLAGILGLFFGPWLIAAPSQPLIAWGYFGAISGIICMFIAFFTWADSKH